MNVVDELLKQRQDQYKDAWKVTGLVMKVPEVAAGFEFLVAATPEYLYPWLMILSKLIRALASPYDIDHWKDIAGYAALVIRDLEGETAND